MTDRSNPPTRSTATAPLAWVTERLRASWQGLDGRPVGFDRRQRTEASAPTKGDAGIQARLRPLPPRTALVPLECEEGTSRSPLRQLIDKQCKK